MPCTSLLALCLNLKKMSGVMVGESKRKYYIYIKQLGEVYSCKKVDDPRVPYTLCLQSMCWRISPLVHPFAQQFLDGEKLVDGMLRRVRSAAMQAGRDPDERLGRV